MARSIGRKGPLAAALFIIVSLFTIHFVLCFEGDGVAPRGNSPPEFNVELKNLDDRGRGVQGEWITFDIVFSDPDNDTVSVEWSWPDTDSLEVRQNGTDLDLRALDPGEYTIGVVLRDGRGGVSTGNRTVEVTGSDDFDHDGDGMPRWWEALMSLDDEDISDAAEDPDGDDLTNLQEYENGTDPHSPDTDMDGMPDLFEVINYPLNPTEDDSAEDPDGDGRSNLKEFEDGTDPTDPDDPGNDGPGLKKVILYVMLAGTVLLIMTGGVLLLLFVLRKNSLEWER